MKKQFFLIPVILALILCLPFLTGSVMADEPEFIDSGTCGENLTWTLDIEGTLTISGEGEMENFGHGASPNKKDPAPWSDYCNEIKNVIVEHGVTSIGDYAFGHFQIADRWSVKRYYYTSLQTVTMADTVTHIGSNAFWFCSALEEITLSQQLISVGESCFAQCEMLTHMEFPDTCVELGGYLFDCCFNLKTVKLPNGLEVINDYLFQGCTALEAIDIPDSVTTLGQYPFSACVSLQNIDIPAGVREIGDFTFSSISREFLNCFTVTFKGSAPTISSFAFYGLESTVYYPADDESWEPWIDQNYGGTLTWEALDMAEPAILYGDANQDNEIDGKDLILLRQHLAGWDVTALPILPSLSILYPVFVLIPPNASHICSILSTSGYFFNILA